jgi:hypothetical protein
MLREVLYPVMALGAVVLAATWLGYPLWLHSVARANPPQPRPPLRPGWPTVTIVLVVRDAEQTIRGLLENLLAVDYPAPLRRILVVANGPADFTAAIAGLYANRGVDVLKIERPYAVAAAAENHARRYIDSELAVVVHPSAQLEASALRALVAPFADPTVGVVYGHEVAARVTDEGGMHIDRPPLAGFEAWLRDHESRVFGTVSARRSLYAMRTALYRNPIAALCSPDFAPILAARERGFRAVYAPDAEVVMLGDRSPRGHYAQMTRAITRDATTLFAKPHLLNPRRYGAFAWILLGHKLGRWLSPWALACIVASLLVLATQEPWARMVVAVGAALALDAVIMWDRRVASGWGRVVAFPGRVAASSVATAHAVVRAVAAMQSPMATVVAETAPQ